MMVTFEGCSHLRSVCVFPAVNRVLSLINKRQFADEWVNDINPYLTGDRPRDDVCGAPRVVGGGGVHLTNHSIIADRS